MDATEPATEVDPFDDLMNSLDESPEEVTAEGGETEPVEEVQEEQAESEAEDALEIEFDGKKLAIPAGTPPELVASVQAMAKDLKADYTQKTQSVAEARRSVEQRAEAIQAQEQILSANFAKAVEYKAVQDKLSQFEQLDWQSLVDSDPAQATKLNLAYQGLQREAARIYGELKQGHEKHQQMTAEQHRKMLEDGQRELLKHIPKWNADTAKAISENATKYGFSPEELSRVADPRLVRALHDAMQWQKLQAEKPKAMQKLAAAPKVLKPGSTQPKRTNQAALDRLKRHGRIEDLAALL